MAASITYWSSSGYFNPEIRPLSSTPNKSVPPPEFAKATISRTILSGWSAFFLNSRYWFSPVSINLRSSELVITAMLEEPELAYKERNFFAECPSWSGLKNHIHVAFPYFAACMQKILLRLLFIWLLTGGNSFAEDKLHPKAISSKTSIHIGEPFQVSVFVDYPAEFQLIFPDSNFAFGNCILKDRRFFPTHTRNEISRDCVVYQLACFNPSDTFHSFSVPVIRFENGDSTRFYSNEIRFRMLSELDSATLKNAAFKADTNPEPVAQLFNYPYVLGFSSLIIIVLLLANFFFDKPMQRFFYLWIERRRHTRYLKAFARIQENLEREASIQQMETLIVLWKQYLQRILGKPFLSYTSLEIGKELPDPVLKKTLQEIDRWIYGGMIVENLSVSMERLKEKSINLYDLKREIIRNGKLGKSL